MPRKHCCVYNMSPFILSSGLSPGSHEVRGPRSASIAWSQVWPGLPTGRFQSGGTCPIAASRARWWSSRDELRAIWPKSCRCLLVTRWESGEQPVVPLTSTFDTWRVYGILNILHSASRRESRYFVVANVLHPYIKTGTMYVWQRCNLVSSLLPPVKWHISTMVCRHNQWMAHQHNGVSAQSVNGTGTGQTDRQGATH